MMEFVVWLIANFMSAIGVTYFYTQYFKNVKRFNLKLLLVFLIGIFISTIIKINGFNNLAICFYFVFYPFLFYCINPMKLNKVYFYSVIIWLYGAIFDFIIMIIISLINNILNFNIYNIWFKIIPTMFALIFFVISAHIPFVKRATNKMVDLLYKIKLFDLLLIVFFIITFIGGVAITVNIRNLDISMLLFSLFILMLVLFVLIIHCKNLDYEFDILVKNLKLNNSFYTNIDDEYSMFKHNLMAKLLSVKSVSNKKGRILIDELIKDFNSNIDYHKLILDLPYGLDGVINQKLSNYNDKLEIKVSNNLEHDIFELLTPKRYNVLVEKLSLFLDNAIEASLSSIDKVLIINILEESDMIKIEIKNTFSGEIDLDNIGKIHYSTKGKKRGLGLYSILRNNIVSVNFKVVNKYFVGEIMAKFSTK